jgi:hypothetical protein
VCLDEPESVRSGWRERVSERVESDRGRGSNSGKENVKETECDEEV